MSAPVQTPCTFINIQMPSMKAWQHSGISDSNLIFFFAFIKYYWTFFYYPAFISLPTRQIQKSIYKDSPHLHTIWYSIYPHSKSFLKYSTLLWDSTSRVMQRPLSMNVTGWEEHRVQCVQEGQQQQQGGGASRGGMHEVPSYRIYAHL